MSDFRIDCLLGFELKSMRVKNELSLMTMSKAIGFSPSKLSKYENEIGALTDEEDAKAIESYCDSIGWKLPTTALTLSKQSKTTDLRPTREMLARWREGDFSQET